MRISILCLLPALFLLLQGPVRAAEEKKSPSEQEFCRLDRDNNREITFDEFQACEFYKLERVKALPYGDPEMKPKGNAVFSDNELKAYLFNKADKNKDHNIDRKEWEEFYNSLMDPGSGRTSHGHHDVR